MKNLLEALECPFLRVIPSNLNDLLVKDQIALVCWLEDRFIREYELNDREGIRATHPQCLLNISQYLSALGCPFAWNSNVSLNASCAANLDAVRWLIEHGVQLSYEDVYGNDESAMDDGQNSYGDCYEGEEKVTPEEVAGRVNKLGELIGVPLDKGEDSIEHLRRILVKVQGSMLSAGMQLTPTTATLKDFPLGFDTGDATLNEVLVVLKMLYLKDLRGLQDEINQLMMLCQDTTANPRLNPALGRVGK